jgi:hypothetical protein
MKNLFIYLFLLMGTVSTVLAQTKTPTATHFSSNSFSQSGAAKTPTHAFNVQLRKSMEEINKDTKSGKLTKAQALAARLQIKNIRIQELQFFKENGNKQLTSNQLTQLNQSLSQLAPSL